MMAMTHLIMPTPLNYSSDPIKRRWPFRFTVVAAPVLLLIGYGYIRGDLRTSADIRLDTGDLRYRYFGIPLYYQRMPEPRRSQLLALAAQSKILTSQWQRCATFPLQSSCSEDFMWRDRYFRASVWASQDPTLARLMLEDEAAALRNQTFGCHFLNNVYVQMDNTRKWVVVPGWQQDPDLLTYMAIKHYTPPATQPTPIAAPTR
jgi:hypothetical protein